MRGPRRIPLSRPELCPEAERAVMEVLRSGQLVRGPRVEAFEARLATMLSQGAPCHVLAVASGTAALEVALAAVGVAAGDEVVIPDLTFPSLAAAIMRLGAEPVPTDVDPDTCNASAAALLAGVTERTKALVPVHQFGLPMNVEELAAHFEGRPIAVVEDAACALGARRGGVYCGTAGRVGCYSFHPRKVLTTGEGGAIVTRDRDLYAHCKRLANHGLRTNGGEARFEEIGWNYRLSEVHAALAVGQIERLEESIARRRSLASAYCANLRERPGVTLPAGHRDGEHTFQSFLVVLDAEIPRREVISGMESAGVEVGIGSHAIHRQPFFRSRYAAREHERRLPGSRLLSRRGLVLPLFPGMERREVDYVCEALATTIGRL